MDIATLGALCGPYRVEKIVATGGTGRILLARDTESHELVALKMPLSSEPPVLDRFGLEARLLADFAGVSRSVVSWRCHELMGVRPWLAMEWVEGCSLSQYVKTLHEGVAAPENREGLLLFEPEHAGSLERALALFQELAAAVAMLHERGVVHADLTPNNVLVRADGCPVLIDFGSAFRDASMLETRDALRQPGRTFGTPGYVAPEVEAGLDGDTRRDLFALGCILWHALSGAAPRPDLALHAARSLPSGRLRDLVVELVQREPEARRTQARAVESIVSAVRGLSPSPLRSVRGPVSRTRLVGRQEPLRNLRSRIEAARAGAGSATVLSGEAGIGKSRLLNEVVAAAHRARFRVLSTTCSDAAFSRPSSLEPSILKPFLAAGLLWGTSRNDTKAAPGFEQAVELDAIFEALTRAASNEPILLVIDDLHWADDLTWAFTRSERLNKLDGTPMCVLASYRTKEPQGRPLSALDGRIWTTLELERLTVDEVRAIAASLLGSQPLPSGADRWLHEVSAGNPLHVTESLRELIAMGDRDAPSSRSHSPADASVPFPRVPSTDWVPRSLSAVLDDRLASVSVAARRCARVAAMLGDEFSLGEIAGPLQALWPAFDVEAALEELRSAFVLEHAGPARFRFSHDLYARCSLRPVPGLDEKFLGQGLAEYYEERLSAERNAAELSRLASLLGQAGSSDRAFDCFCESARIEAAAGKVTRTRALYLQALEQLGALSENEQRRRARSGSAIHAELADLLHREARYDEADAHYERSLSLAAHELRGIARASLLRKRARALRAPNRYDAATEILAAAREELGKSDGTREFWSEWIEIEETRFWLTYYARKPFGKLLEELEPVVLEHGTSLQQSDFYQCACASLLAASRYRGSEPACRYAARALEAIRSTVELRARVPDACMVAGFPLLWCERPQWLEAIVLFEEAERGSIWMDDLTLLAQTRTYLALAHRRCGDVEKCEATARAAYSSADRTDSRGYRGASLASLAWVSWMAGDLKETDRLAREAWRWWREGALRHPFQCFLNLVWADVLRVTERFEEAQARLSDLLAPDLQALPPSLEDAIVRATDGQERDARATDKALMLVTQTAHRAGYL